MASLEMHGAFSLDAAVVTERIMAMSPGNFALGRLSDDETTFLVAFIGRADTDVRKPLLYWADEGSFTHFKFSYAPSAKAAFEKECNNYHDFGQSEKLQNTSHPRSDGKRWQCPRCPVFKELISLERSGHDHSLVNKKAAED